MAQPTLPADGGCRCGRIRFTISAPPLLTTACHCRGCQRMTASAYSLSAAIPTDGFAITQGEPEPGGMHAPGQDHRHCGWCKSWVFTLLPPETGFVNVRASMLDDPYWFTPFVEVETAEKLPFADTHAAHSFERMPAMEEWGGLVEAYRSAQ